MIATNQLDYVEYSDLGSPLPTSFDISATYPNGALDGDQVQFKVYIPAAGWIAYWSPVDSYDDDTRIATITYPAGWTSGVTLVRIQRMTPRYTVYLDPEVQTNRVSQRNLQTNADQGLFGAMEWAGQFGIDVQEVLLPDPESLPNQLGLQQQTMNYFGPDVDYSTHVWNFNFAGGYIDRTHVKVQAKVNGAWQLLDLVDPVDYDQHRYIVHASATDYKVGPFECNEDGVIEEDEYTGVVYDHDIQTAPFKFIGDYQLSLDFSVLPAMPTGLIIFRHTPRDVRVNSPLDAALITAGGMDPSTRHSLFVAVEIGERLSMIAPECACDIGAQLQTVGWRLAANHTDVNAITLTGSPYVTYTVDMWLIGDMETRVYSDHATVVGGGGRFVRAGSPAGGDPFNVYELAISDPPAKYYVNNRLAGEGNTAVFRPDGSDTYKLTVQVKGNATLTFNATDVEGASNYTPQFGIFNVKVVSSDA